MVEPVRPAPGAMVDLPPEFRTTPLSFYVWSRSPRASHILALAVARFIDASFRWVSIRTTPEVPSEEEPWVARLVPRDRILEPIAGSEHGSGRRVRRQTFDAFIRPEGATVERIALDHLLLLPERLQGILDEHGPLPVPRVIVVANTNRVREFYPKDPEGLRAYTEVYPRHGISMITTSVPPPYKGRYGFDIVLRMDVTTEPDWRTAQLIVEKGLRSGEFRTGTTYPTADLPWYLDAGASVERSLH